MRCRDVRMRYGDKFRFSRATGRLHWADTHWALDETGKINEASYETAERIKREVLLQQGVGLPHFRREEMGCAVWA